MKLHPGSIRIEIHMGHKVVVHLHRATIDANIGIDHIVHRIQNQKETTDDIWVENPRAVVQAEKIGLDLRDKELKPEILE